MTQRNRSRNAGLIDTALAETVPYPIVPGWVSGRFYDCTLNVGALSTGVLSTTAYLIPIVVPYSVTVTSIGIEITVAGGAGSLERLAIYNDRESKPEDLIVDAGTVVADATGFQSAVISTILRAGIYWLGIANKSVTSNPTVRTQAAASLYSITRASTNDVTLLGVSCVTITNPAANNLVDLGWTRKIFLGDATVALTGNVGVPRVMIGV